MSVHAVKRSLGLLQPGLRKKVKQVIALLTMFRFPVALFETGRTLDRQRWILKQGYSKTLKSRHLSGEAADFVVKVDRKWSWDYKKYYLYYLLFGAIAVFCGLEWGGNWKKFKDYPHVQLKRRKT
jgi:peptidoglycan L-alanyl-D-glutamate endopeptidase CwlK